MLCPYAQEAAEYRDSMTDKEKKPEPAKQPPKQPQQPSQIAKVREIGGQEGPDPTRYGDWGKGRTLHRFLMPLARSTAQR